MPDEFLHLLNWQPVGGWEKEALTKTELAAARPHPNPSESQKETGNYKHGHVSWKGIAIAIETAKGQMRRGVGKDGKPWKTELHASYGRIKKTEGADGDQVDIFLCDHYLDSEIVFIVNQVDPDTGKWDEHKVVAGALSEDHARRVYLSCYEDGWKGLGSIVPMTLVEFKKWLKGDTSKAVKAAGVHELRVILVKRAADDNEDRPFTIAVDLDGTLAEVQKPFDPDTIGPPRAGARAWVEAFKDAGARIIVFTVRGNTELVEDWMNEHRIPFDSINHNPDNPEDSSGKVIADAYLDDRAINAEDLEEAGPEVLRQIAEHADEETDEDNGKCLTIERIIITAPEHLLEALLEHAS